MRTSLRIVGTAAAMGVVVSACFQGGKVEASRQQQEREQRGFDAAKAVGCFCVSGVRCNSPESSYPETPYAASTERAGSGGRCCVSSNCQEGLACDPTATPVVCAPIEDVARKETVMSCSATAPKIWDQSSPASCELRGRDAPGWEPLRQSMGPELDRVRYVTAADRSTLRSIDRGVFVVLSGAGSRAWGSTVVPPSLTMLREVLGNVPANVEVVVAEKRCLTKELVELLKLRCDARGDGEVAWIRRGEVVATTGYGIHPERVIPNTERLLALP